MKSGFFDITNWPAIRIEGSHAASFLQRMTTANVEQLCDGFVTYAAFLTGNGRAVALGQLWRKSKECFYFLGLGSAHTIANAKFTLDHIDKFHFGEKFTASIDDQIVFLAVYGDASLRLLELDTVTGDMNSSIRSLDGISFSWWIDKAMPELALIAVDKFYVEELINKSFSRRSIKLLDQNVYEYLRIKSQVPVVGQEIDSNNLFMEANFPMAIHRNKGCYPGQEVVERIFTYGSVNRKLHLCQMIKDRGSFTVPSQILKEGKQVGELRSWVAHPTSIDKYLGQVMLRKPYWDIKEEWSYLDPSDGIEIKISLKPSQSNS